jgi:riboflavin synthase
MSGGLFSVFIIPHTWEHTNLRSAAPGRRVNIEIDILAKYVERLFPRDGA